MAQVKICPRCQFYNQDKNKRCLKCDWTLDPIKNLPPLKPGLDYNKWGGVRRTVLNIFRAFRRFFHSEIPETSYRFPFLAAGLSLVFGLGQVYNRQYKKAFFFFCGYIIGLCIVIPTLTKPYSNLIILLFIAYALYTYNDGLVTAVKINGQQWTLRYTLAAYSALFFVLGMGTVIGQFAFVALFKLVHVTQSTIQPFFYKGDIVYVDCLAYKFRKPHRGEIIFYTPEPFEIEIPAAFESTRYWIQERRTFERIMGLPGDVVERKAGKFYLNGSPMPSWCQPLLPDNIFNDLRFVVPGDRVLAIFSHSPKESEIFGPLTSWGGKTPPLTAPGIILIGWDKICYVQKKQIIGRALFVINPPPHRRFFLSQ